MLCTNLLRNVHHTPSLSYSFIPSLYYSPNFKKFSFTSLISYGCLLLFTNMLFKCENIKVALGHVGMAIPTYKC